jgi:hypothetical protein
MLFRSHIVPALLASAPLISSCVTGTIPNTDVPDTHENREVIDVAEHYRRAVEQRDVRALLSLAAPNYFEDGGTPQGDDDYGYDGLRRLLSVWNDEVREVRYEMRYRRVTFEHEGNRALVDFTYTGSFTLRRPPLQVGGTTVIIRDAASTLNIDPARATTPVTEDSEVWFRRVADNRLELEKVDGQWRIVSGM